MLLQCERSETWEVARRVSAVTVGASRRCLYCPIAYEPPRSSAFL